MKQRFILFFLFLSVALGSFAQTGYNINLTLKPYKNQYVYLAYHYGKIKALADSVKLDENSQGTFKGKDMLPGGIYIVVSPQKVILFEILLDKQQNFSIVGDTTQQDFVQKLEFKNSTDNSLFQNYTNAIAKMSIELNQLKATYDKATTKSDSVKIQAEMQKKSTAIQQYRDDLEKKNPNAFLTTILKWMKEPQVPEAPKGGTPDKDFAYHYFKAHYWDNISFTDERLLRMPESIFEGRLEKYYNELVVPTPDSVNKEIDYMLQKSEPDSNMYKFLLVHFIQDYINPKYMGMDAVYLHLFEKYINNKPIMDWFTKEYKKYMTDRAYSIMANQLGMQAQNLEMVDTSGNARNLYDVKAPYTVIFFWDPTCGHCKEQLPHVDSMFQHKWKQEGIALYGVMVDGGKEAWMKMIHEKDLKGWIHVYETEAHRDAVYAAGQANYKQLYDVFQTPVLYLLDKDKRIIAKKIDYQQAEDILQLKMKQEKEKQEQK